MKSLSVFTLLLGVLLNGKVVIIALFIAIWKTYEAFLVLIKHCGIEDLIKFIIIINFINF